jgi:hypothetical protein
MKKIFFMCRIVVPECRCPDCNYIMQVRVSVERLPVGNYFVSVNDMQAIQFEKL